MLKGNIKAKAYDTLFVEEELSIEVDIDFKARRMGEYIPFT